LRRPTVPELNLRGLLVMACLALLLLICFAPVCSANEASSPDTWPMFFLDAGFLLLETRAVVHLALLFGSTWLVNAAVLAAVLLLVLLANGVTGWARPSLPVVSVALFATLAGGGWVPVDVFLGWYRPVQVIGASLLVLAPLFFAGVIFAIGFRQTVAPARALAANLAGAMVGGWLEYSSLLIGFGNVSWVALGLYGFAALSLLKSRARLQPPR